VQVAVDCAGVEGRRRQHRRRPRGKLARAATSSGDNNAATTVEAGSSPVHDLAGMEPLRSSMPPVWINPMLEEFAILLQVATSSVTVALRTADSSSPVQAVPPQTGPAVLVVEAPVAGPSLPMDGLMADQATSGLSDMAPTSGEAVAPSQPSVLEAALLTPPRASQLDVVCGDETPTSLEAARRLARFLDEVRVEREPPLIAAPPRQRTHVRRPPPVRPRSSRIAAQPLAHIPASKRGEVLLNRRLGNAPPTATDSPAPRGILDALRTGTLSSSEVEGLDALFPVFNGRASELFRDDS